jgi:galactokinase
VAAERSVVAFAPGRVNLIGEHTDYNQGLALPFAIAEGVTVRGETIDGAPAGGLRPGGSATAGPRSSAEDPDQGRGEDQDEALDRHPGEARERGRIEAHACDLGEEDEFALADPQRADGWRAFVRGTVAELAGAGFPLVGARLEIGGGLPAGAGLSSSAALEVALCLALLELGRGDVAAGTAPGANVRPTVDRTELARLCARVENDWVGAQTGLLDQLASLYGEADTALCIDFRTLEIEPVPLRLKGWRLAVLDSGERHVHAGSGYNERRAECARACELLGVGSLRDADVDGLDRLPQPLRSRARHVIEENGRVREAVAALKADELPALGALLSASHASLRENYDISTPAVELTVERMLDAGAAGARIVGGGFGGSVLGLFAPGLAPPAGAREVRPGPGARLLESAAETTAGIAAEERR